MQQTQPQKIQDDDDISLADIIRFFGLNGKFILLVTGGLSAITISLSLLQPKPTQYQKQLTLSISSVPTSVSAFPKMDDNQASTIAVRFLQNLKLETVTPQAKYDPVTKQIDLTLQSSNANALQGAGAKAVRQVETGFEQIMGKSIDTTVSSVETQIQKHQQIINQLKQRSTQFSPTNEFRLGATETLQTQYLTALTGLEFDKEYLERSKKNLAEFTSRVISVEILTESDKPLQSRSPVKLAVITVIASFVAAVFAAIVRDQIQRLKKELSHPKPHRNSGV